MNKRFFLNEDWFFLAQVLFIIFFVGTWSSLFLLLGIKVFENYLIFVGLTLLIPSILTILTINIVEVMEEVHFEARELRIQELILKTEEKVKNLKDNNIDIPFETDKVLLFDGEEILVKKGEGYEIETLEKPYEFKILNARKFNLEKRILYDSENDRVVIKNPFSLHAMDIRKHKEKKRNKNRIG